MYPGRSPCSPVTRLPVALIGLHRFPTRPRNHRKGRHRDAPLRRTPTLTHAVPQATKNKHFEQLEMQFSDGCCLKNTQCVSGPRMVIGAIAGNRRIQNRPIRHWIEKRIWRSRRPTSSPQSAAASGFFGLAATRHRPSRQTPACACDQNRPLARHYPRKYRFPSRERMSRRPNDKAPSYGGSQQLSAKTGPFDLRRHRRVPGNAKRRFRPPRRRRRIRLYRRSIEGVPRRQRGAERRRRRDGSSGRGHDVVGTV